MESSFENLIKSLLVGDDMYIILKSPLTDRMPLEVQLKCRNNVKIFFEEFKKMESDTKIQDFIAVSKDISEWIPRLLGDTEEAKAYQLKFTVIFELLHLQMDDAVNSFPMNEAFLRECCVCGLLTVLRRDELIAKLGSKGNTAVKYQFLWELQFRKDNAYSLLLVQLYKWKTNYIEKFCDDLHKMICQEGVREPEKINCIMAYGESVVNSNMNIKLTEPDDNVDPITVQYDCPQGASGECIVETDLFAKKEVTPEPMDLEALDKYEVRSRVIRNDTRNFAETVTKLDESKDSEFSDDEDDDGSNNGEGEDFDILFGELKNRSADELLNFSSVIDKTKVVESSDLAVRGYQEELASEGIKGRNVLICAPTGSGKTIVAVKIVEEHLKSNPQGKVAFIVHRIALVEQQYAQFSKYLKCRITRLSGSVKSTSTPLIGHIPSFDIFVMTSDILRNALEQDNETKLESVNKFTMILFDECHNCDKKHPYNRIMNHYFKSQREENKVPQIIGLTASTGTNKANTMDKAMKRLYTLCANLDCYTVSTVKDCIEELKENQSVPGEEVIAAPSRANDNFDSEMQKHMRYCENLLLQMNDRDFFPKDPSTQSTFSIPEDRMHQKYANFVGKLEQQLLNHTKTENEGREAIYAISNYLNALVRALMVNHLFRAQDSVKLLKDSIETTAKPTCKVEAILRKKLRSLSHGGEFMQTENPCLRILKERIQAQLAQDPTSRIIVFVRERTYTQILKDVFTSLDDPRIKCDTIVGNTISAEKGGLTQNEMEEVLGRFRSGKSNVLFSTTVAEEGLDVQKCNLVIRYGHVTNETAMVQSRGRARALDSKYLVIVPSKLQWQINKENINKYRESMMYRAIERFQDMDKDKREFQIEECKCERQLLETTEKLKKTSLKNGSATWRFCCKKCLSLICTSGDIRLAENAHHLVVVTTVFDRMALSPEKNQILCKKCSNLLGNRQSYKNRFFPNLTITAFSLICEGEEQSRSYKKWKDVPFEVRAVSNNELLLFPTSHILSN